MTTREREALRAKRDAEVRLRMALDEVDRLAAIAKQQRQTIKSLGARLRNCRDLHRARDLRELQERGVLP